MIKVHNLAKVFGTKHAVDGISFSVERGEVLGFLGPNGAGKSTTMRMITGFIPPTDGSVTVGGFDVVENPIESRRLIGYLPENAPAYTDMTVYGFLKFCGEIRGLRLSRGGVWPRIGHLPLIRLSTLPDTAMHLLPHPRVRYRSAVLSSHPPDCR